MKKKKKIMMMIHLIKLFTTPCFKEFISFCYY
jgi:hypothetical protein